LLAKDDPAAIYDDQKVTFALARISECNPCGFF